MGRSHHPHKVIFLMPAGSVSERSGVPFGNSIGNFFGWKLSRCLPQHNIPVEPKHRDRLGSDQTNRFSPDPKDPQQDHEPKKHEWMAPQLQSPQRGFGLRKCGEQLDNL